MKVGQKEQSIKTATRLELLSIGNTELSEFVVNVRVRFSFLQRSVTITSVIVVAASECCIYSFEPLSDRDSLIRHAAVI